MGGGGGVYEGMGFEEKRFERFLGGGRGVWYGTNVRISSIFSRLKRIVSRGRRRRSIIYLQLSICQKKNRVPTELVIIPGDSTYFNILPSMYVQYLCMGDLIERTYCCRPQQAAPKRFEEKLNQGNLFGFACWEGGAFFKVQV